MTLTELYQSARTGGVEGEIARQLLDQTHWFTANAEFDPKTGEALPQALSAFLARLASENPGGQLQDRLYRIVEHARPAVERLLRALHESPRREHAIMPVRSVRELDAGSFIKLSMRPGRNIREKLAGKPYLQAIRRFQSVNLPENRLLKAYVSRLAELLELRQDCLGEPEDDLLIRIQSWLLSDVATTIGGWENLPPNNALLAHRDYRRVWDSWRRLQTLDEDITRDLSRLDIRRDTMRRWMDHGQMYRDGSHLFAEMPVLFDYEGFSIRTWQRDPLVQRSRRRQRRCYGEKTVAEPVCVDFTEMRPRYAVTPEHPEVLTEAFIWQQWRNAAETVDIALFNADAAYLHPDATTIASSDLFFTDEGTTVHCDRAARAFASRLRGTFRHDKIIWLVPDALNDFELEVVRRNLNARFPGAEPLPRSVAAVFEQVDYTQVRKDGYSVLVVDTLGGTTCAIRLTAKSAPGLKKRIPETNGYYWERCPPVVLSEQDVAEERRYDMITVDSNGQWTDSALPERPQSIAPKILKADQRIGQFDILISLSGSPVAGGIRLYGLQARAGDTPLWRDQIPELAIKGYIDGFYRRFYLVSRIEPIKPIRGQATRIPIKKRFILPAGKPFYQFPLYQGDNAAELRFSVRLDSPAFPLKVNTECDLILIFQYGEDEPYTLSFHPVDGSFPDVRASWQPTTQAIETDALAPEYPKTKSWAELHRFPDTQRGGTIDLIQEAASTSSNLHRWMNITYDDAHEKLQKNIRGWCRFLFFSVWRDGRSIADIDCPAAFITTAHSLLNTLQNATEHGVSVYDVMVLMSSMHKDMPDECVEWIYEQVESGKPGNARSIGFALGDLSEMWQQYVFDVILSRPNMAIDVLAYAIWREQNCLSRLTLKELVTVLNALSERLQTTQPHQRKDGILELAVTPLELLLGLLRTRASNNPDIRMLLQPHQKMTKRFAKQIDRIEDILAETHVTLFSRVQINIQKPEGVRTPDLLYALRLYLTGDTGANAIHITGISDSDDD